MGPVKLVASVFHLIVSGALWFLDVSESYLYRIGGYVQVYDDTKEDSLYQSTQPKRKKLLVDIRYLPDNKFEFISVTTKSDEATPWLPRRILRKLTFYALKATHFVRKILSNYDTKSSTTTVATPADQKQVKKGSRFSPRWIVKKIASSALNLIHLGRDILTTLDSRISAYVEPQVPNIKGPDTGSRKKISPRKRLPQAKRHVVRRCIMKLFYVEPDGFSFDPVEDSGEDEGKHKVPHNPANGQVSTNHHDDGDGEDKQVELTNGDDQTKYLSDSDDNKSLNDKDYESDSMNEIPSILVSVNDVDVNVNSDLNEDEDTSSEEDDEDSQNKGNQEDENSQNKGNQEDSASLMMNTENVSKARN